MLSFDRKLLPTTTVLVLLWALCMSLSCAFQSASVRFNTKPSFISTDMRKSPCCLSSVSTPTIESETNTGNDNLKDDSVLTVGIFGGGVVGGGIVEILESKKNHFKALTGGKKTIEVKKVCVRDASKERDWKTPDDCEIVTNYSDILDDPTIDMVVEVMGGTNEAKDVVYEALQKGKDVVTANKALIAAYLPEIESLLNEVNEKIEDDAKKVEFRYEAAVCGGIPIIRSLQSDFVGDDISSLCGIINGCTNFMLTAMDRDGKSYDEALKQAGELGYAEADPTLDVGGFDARSKLHILIRLAFGMDVLEDEIRCEGITQLDKVDFEYAKMLGGTIKLVGLARRVDQDHGGKHAVAAFVSPAYISSEDTLASVAGATNAIDVMSKNLKATTYIGEGAGRYPTANSCVNDIVSLARGDTTPLPFNVKKAASNEKDSDVKFVNDYKSSFYIRVKYRDELGITRQCGRICEEAGVSIHSLLQNPKAKKSDSAFVIITEEVNLSSVMKVAASLEGLDWCFGKVFYMPVLSDDII